MWKLFNGAFVIESHQSLLINDNTSSTPFLCFFFFRRALNFYWSRLSFSTIVILESLFPISVFLLVYHLGILSTEIGCLHGIKSVYGVETQGRRRLVYEYLVSSGDLFERRIRVRESQESRVHFFVSSVCNKFSKWSRPAWKFFSVRNTAIPVFFFFFNSFPFFSCPLSCP